MQSRRLAWVAVTTLWGLAACGPGTPMGDANTMDAASMEGGGSPDAPPEGGALEAAADAPAPPELQVSIGSPTETAYVRDTVTVQAVVLGGAPDEVLLLRDGMPLATLTAPYQYSWDVRAVPEASYALTVRATRSGRAYTSAPRTVVVDRTPPTVAALTPTAGATAVDTSIPITARFSEPMLGSSVTDSTVTLSATPQGGSPTVLARTATLDAAGTTLTLAPTGSYARPATLTATLTAGLTDRAGNALVPPGNPWTWSAPEWVRYATELFSAPARLESVVVGADVQGIVVVALVNNTMGLGVPLAWRLMDGRLQPLAAPPTPTMGSLRSLRRPILDGSGRLVLVAEVANTPLGSPTALQLVRLEGNAWTALPPLAFASGDSTAGVPSTDDTGAPCVALSGAARLRFQRLSGGSWGTWLPDLEPPAGQRFDGASPNVVRAADGTLYVHSVVGSPMSWRPGFWRSLPSGWVEVMPPPGQSLSSFAWSYAGPSGDRGVFALFNDYQGAPTFALWNGGSWLPLDSYLPGTRGEPDYDSIQADRSRRTMLLFTQYASSGGGSTVTLATLEGRSWSLSPELSRPVTPMASPTSYASLTADATNHRWIAWGERTYAPGASTGIVYLVREN